MQTLFVQEMPRDGRRTSIQRVASVVLHLVLLAAFTFQFHKVVKAVARPHKVAAVIIPYAPGHQAVVQKPKPKIQPPKDPPKLPLKQPDPPPVSSGGDPTGEDDVSVATADFYPDPKPDLAMLPHGTNGDVVVDIVIDESGKVVETTLDQGLGHGFDEAVMAVIQTWTFTPATKAGKPVASKQQLLFHFVRA
ncbi:energy transducer TonB [Terriglobus roseus]|uniref:Protein TonB n=1 Tax=Terriglobus roseus TaxID=392734 RepID=A0A1G7QZG6_9BACT|nr:energy transducer TonB [Terriglobus roseus]SDG03875.1 protein TonB [Terriglobus roseus]